MDRDDKSWDSSSKMISEAMRITSSDRQDKNGPPEDNFERIGMVFTALLKEKLLSPVTAADVARCMVGLKLVRDAHKPQWDNRVDGVGYFRCLERIEPTEK